MKPIGQTFYINTPQNGVAGIYVYSISVYFKRISTSKTITLQLRETDNGYPTSSVIPNSTCMAFPTGTYNDSIPNPEDYGGYFESRPLHNVAYASDGATIPTEFKFTEPVFLESNKSFAFVLIPGGGTDEYEVWTSEIGQKDVYTGDIVTRNNETGTLFISSNDIQWTPVQTEDIKFELKQYEWNQNNLSGEAIFNIANSDIFYIKNISGNFKQTEIAYVTNAVFEITNLTVSSTVGTFSVNETVFQSNGSANVAVGKLIYSNTSNLVLANTLGAFTTSYQVKGLTSSANASVTNVLDDTTFTSGSTTINVPASRVFATNQIIAIGHSSGANIFFKSITGITSNTSISVNSNLPYTESSGAFIATVQTTQGFFNTQDTSNTNQLAVSIGRSRDLNSSRNLSNDNILDQYIIGATTGAMAKIISKDEISYNSLMPQLLEFAPKDTGITYSFRGLTDDGSYVHDDSDYTYDLKLYQANELFDKQRILSNYSNELQNRSGIANTSFRIKANLQSVDYKISPMIDLMSRFVTLTENYLVPEDHLSGYYLTLDKKLENTKLVPAVGSQVTYGSNTATVAYANTTFVRIINNTGDFHAGTMTFDSFTDSVSVAEYYSENFDNGYDGISRYISKTNILAPDQDADDAKTYLTAYRPVGTEIRVYIKAQSVNDISDYNSRVWTEMNETDSVNLLSSKANLNDYIELIYDIPTSQTLFANDCSCSSTSNNITLINTETLNIGDFLYIKDNSNSTFTVKEITSVTNSSVVVLSSNVGFSSTNAAIGIIPGLNHESGVFKYDNNEYISRYVNPDGDVHDTIKSFSIKIILTGDNHYIIPRVADMRTLALQN